MLELLFAALGFLFGALSGLVPALHNNTLTEVLLSLHLPLEPHLIAIFIIAMAGARVVFEFVPSIFLFVPDENTVLSVLPGQRMLMEGKGLRALRVTACSALLSLALSVMLAPLALALFQGLYQTLRPFSPFFLIFASAYLLSTERRPGKVILATVVFLLSGALGIFVLHGTLLRDPFLPSFTGLFAMPALLLALRSPRPVPAQERRWEVDARTLLPSVLTGIMLGALADLFPGLSSAAQISVFASAFLYFTPEKFLATVSAIATSHTVFSLIALVSTNKARIGAAVAVSELLGDLGGAELLMLLGAAAVSIAVSAATLIAFGEKIAGLILRIDNKALNLLLLAFIPLFVLLLEGASGIIVLLIASALGLIPPLAGVRRTHLMGLILVPTMLWLFQTPFW